MDQGIEIYHQYAGNQEQTTALVLLGDHKMDVLRILGNPNKEYYKADTLYLNFLEIGIDVVMGSDYRVSKLILHTNMAFHPHFCFYSRCFY